MQLIYKTFSAGIHIFFAKNNARKNISLYKNKKGETLVEVMISTFLISVAFISISIISQNNKETNLRIQQKITALSLADEALEAVRQIRDTNWIRYNGLRRECWNFSVDNNSAANDDTPDGMKDSNDNTCTGSSSPKLTAGPYLLEIEPTTFEWFLTKKDAAVETSTTQKRLPNASRLYIDPTTNVYRPILSTTGLSETSFYREIFLSYPSPTEMEIEAVVEWSNSRGWGAEVAASEVRIKTILTDHLGREVSL